MKALKCATYNDELRLVDVESSFNRGLPALNIVGLAGASIKESAERVKSALLSLNFSFQPISKVFDFSGFSVGFAMTSTPGSYQ